MAQHELADSVVQADHIFQARFPSLVVDWLRTQWYRRRIPMNSVIVETVSVLRRHEVTLDATDFVADDHPEAHRFTVRLSGPDYDWLRREAFVKRVSINKLLTVTLAKLAAQDGVVQVSDQDATLMNRSRHQ